MLPSRQKEQSLSHARLLQLLDYDQETGILRHRVARGRNAKAGSIAGHIRKAKQREYMTVGLGGFTFLAHRLIWFYMTGAWPKGQIDHRDLNKTNNAWSNLREAAAHQNCSNRKVRADSGSGLKGVSLRKGRTGPRWRAILAIHGKKRHLGYFASPEAAHDAYKVAALEACNEFARY